MVGDADLLFLVFAHRAGLIDSDQLVTACAVRAANSAVRASELLLARGWINEEGRALVERLVEEEGNEPAEPTDSPMPPLTEEKSSPPNISGVCATEIGAHSANAETGMGGTLLGELPTERDDEPASALPPTIRGPGVPLHQRTLSAEGPTAAGTRESDDAGFGHPSDQETVEFTPSTSRPTHRRVKPLLTEEERTRERYTLTRLHAKGGIGQVWVARDTTLGREVALKELRPEGSGNPIAWARFLEEARITGQLEHPGIVPVYELKGQAQDQQPFYTMRFIRGRTLSAAAHEFHEKRAEGKAGPLERAVLLNAFVSVCHAVAYAHSRGVIHRDLKGQNVVLGDFGEVMVLDWGLAKLVNAPAASGAQAAEAPTVEPSPDWLQHDATVQGRVLGTPAYMAPEQAEGRIDAIDQRTDVYGLGAILYEVLSDQRPFLGTDTHDLLRRVREEEPEPLHRIDPSVPRALEAICRRAMAKRQEDRYQSAADLGRDVQRWLADEPVIAYREPATVRLRRWARRHRTAVAAAAALLLTATIALAVSSVLVRRERDEARHQRDVANRQRQIADVQRNEARRQREQARRAVDDMYTQVAEQWLEDRLDPLQRSFLEKALAYYDGFTAEDAADPTVRQEHGRAYLRKADVLRKLGRHREADLSYRNAIDRLDELVRSDPETPEHRFHLASAQAHLAASLAARGKSQEAEAFYRKARDLQRELVKQGPAARYALAVAQTEKGLADLHRVTGRTELAETEAQSAIKHLEPLATARRADVAPRQELAASLDVLGLLLRDRNRPRDAEAAYRKARGLLEPLVAEAPTVPPFRDLLAKVYNSLGLLVREHGNADEAETILRAQVTQEERLAADFPDRPDYRRALARSLKNLAMMIRERGQTREAEQIYRRALVLNERLAADFPAVLIYRRDQARCLANLGELLSRGTRRAEAEKLYRQAQAIYEQLIAEAPDVPDHKNALAGTLVNLGVFLADNGRAPDAESTYGQAAERYADLTARFPDNPDYARGQATCLNNMGGVLLAAGKYDAADAAFTRAVGAYQKLLSHGTHAVDDLASLANTLGNQGEVRRRGRLAGGQEVLRQAVEIWARVVREQTDRPDFKRGCAVAWINLGESLDQAGQAAEAEQAFRQSLTLVQNLSGSYPTEPEYKSDLGYELGDLAKVALAGKRPADARPLFDQAIAADRAALAGNAQNVGYRANLQDHLAKQAECLADLGLYGDASRTAQEAIEIDRDRPGKRTELARVFTRCALLARADSAVTKDQQADLESALAECAIALLREALDKRDPAMERIADDAEFDPLRTRESFKALPFALLAKPRPAVE
jgi:serine/threonine-protein kinase